MCKEIIPVYCEAHMKPVSNIQETVSKKTGRGQDDCNRKVNSRKYVKTANEWKAWKYTQSFIFIHYLKKL
jgi:hypothetical protein